MRDGWIEATLKEALEPIANRPDGKDYPLVLSVTEKRGIIPQTEIFNHRIATDDISKYKVLEPMDIAYNPYLLWCGAIGQWQGTEAGVVSPVYECFRVKSNCEPRYLGYIFETGILTNYFDALAIGSIVRRRRTIPSDFIAAPIQLPPLPEQKRIVDLVSSVDSYIAALKQQLESTKKSRKAVLRELLTAGGTGWEESTLGDLISHSIGGIWGEEQGGAEVDVPVYRQTEFSDSGILTTPAEAIRSVSKSQLKNRTLQEGDILIQKSAGTPNLPGRVVSVPNLNGEVATFSNFLNLLRPDTLKCIPRLAFLIFWDKHHDGRAFQYQRGTNIKNLDLPSYLLETILIPSAPDQKRIVELISTFDDFLAHTNDSISLFENLRSGLLSDLLSGNHEIPSTYEKVMGAA
jgi:restriction endonuclease S subunit